MVGKLERVSLREVWAKEAADFTTWLGKNLEILSEQIDLSLSLIEVESRVGSFSADLYAEDQFGDTVVIENQLEKTDHDHLGKLLTYLVNLDAKSAIWITSEPRPEHISVINWLNEVSPDDISFYLVKVEAFRIGTSNPAPLFSVISAPTQEVKNIGKERGELAGRHAERFKFWSELLEKAKDKTALHANVSPGKDNWLVAGAGRSGLGFSYVITMSQGVVELFIDRGPGKEEETYKIFEELLTHRAEIEETFEAPLLWDRKEGRRVCRIRWVTDIGGLKDTEKWAVIQEQMIERMAKLEAAFRPFINKLKQ